MRSLLSLLLSAVLVVSSAITTEIHAAPSNVDPLITLRALVNQGWENSSVLRQRLEEDFKITLTKENAYRSWRAALPEYVARLESLTGQRWGISVSESDDGSTTIRSISGEKAFVLPPWVGPAGFIWLLFNVELFADRGLELLIISELERRGWDHDDAEKEANYLTDLNALLITLPAMAVGLLFILFEFIQEQGSNRYGPGERRHRLQNQYKPPGDTMIGGPCGLPASTYDGYGLTGEKPGTDLLTFDGGVIFVIGKDPCH